MASSSSASPFAQPPAAFLPVDGSAAGPSSQGVGAGAWPPASPATGGAQLPATASPSASRTGLVAADASSYPSSSSSSSGFLGVFGRAYDAFARARANLDLPYPGLPERINHEAMQTFTTNHLFDGVRFDLAKGASINPMFHVSHNFHLGASQAPMGTYSFSTMYGTDEIFATGNVDDQGAVSARLNRRWSPTHTSKVQAQLVKGFGQTMFQAEHVVNGRDNAFALKSINANPADGTGMYMLSYLQSLTKNLAVGVEAVYARQPGAPEDVTKTYMLKYSGGPSVHAGEKPEWIASASLVTQGVLQASYWHRLSEKVDAAAELTVIGTPSKREAEAKVAAKWDFRLASLRAQLDNFGRLTSVYEARLFPSFSMTFAAELDHLRSAAKFGFGVSIETPLGGEDPTAPQPAMPSPPFY
ncbi:translocase of outer mitochondrial membrane [Tilletia horrida]|uniref:Translocase of outer mitochondrial membrane n=1 Tax=Tilletia horrida TaxID=155126 RepID=A0AAN6JN39_9BASI|nr:translocase of outer mitochondrial membrane [Tilletia horrida]KAK0521681.1 translocase of outer mitochondrial membrane [Tilletia horrida]KAK0556175.1 translocase of outer mitochondrial membrane [Tilletia horrida]